MRPERRHHSSTPASLGPARLAIYSTADGRYVPACVVALTSFRRFHPECAYYLIANGRRLGAEQRELLEEFDITLVDVDLSDVFPVSRENPWPSEAFWQLYGPKAFAERGHRYALAVDGDVFCTRAMVLAPILSCVETFAGNDNGPSRWLLREPERLASLLDVSLLDWPAPNAGVLFYNSDCMAERGLFERAAELYKAGRGWAFQHVGDQALLAMTALALEMKMLPLGCEWNFRFDLHVTGSNGPLLHRLVQRPRRGMEEVFVLHFLGGKPWTPYPDLAAVRRALTGMVRGGHPEAGWNTGNRARVYWVNVWRAYARALLGTDRARRYFGGRATDPIEETLLGRAWLGTWDRMLWLRHLDYKWTQTPWGVSRPPDGETLSPVAQSGPS